MHPHLMDEAAFEDAEARWQQTLSLSQSLSTAIGSLKVAMVAATFGSFEYKNVQHAFETRTLPCAITTIIGRGDLENDLPALAFLQHAVEFFIRTIDRDNESLMEALRPVIVFRPAAVNNPRIRAPTNGPYDFYANNILTTGRSSTFDGIQIPLSLYHDYPRGRRKGPSRASPPRTHRLLSPECESETAVSRDSRVSTPRARAPSTCETSDAAPPEDDSEGDMIGPPERPRPLAGRWGQAPREVGNSGVQLVGVDTEAAAAAAESVTAGEPAVGVRKRECSNPGAGEANENRKGEENQGICRQGESCGARGASVEATDKGVAERNRNGNGDAGGGDSAEYTDSRGKGAEDKEARGEERGGAPAKCVTSQLSEKDLEQWEKAVEADDPGSAGLVHSFLELDCQSEPAGEATKNGMDVVQEQAHLIVRGPEIEATAKATVCAATLPDAKSKALLSAACRVVGDEDDSDGDDDMVGDSMTGEDSEDDEHYDEDDYEPESIILHEEKAKAVFDDGFEETCPHYLSILNWFARKRGIAALGNRLDSRPPPKATIVRGLVEMLCSVAEVLPNDDAEDILRMTRSRLETYLEEVSPEDLKRSPETRAALFGAMDHVSDLMSTLGHLPKEDKLAVLSTRYSLCLQYLKGPTLQVRLAGLLELSKTNVNVQVALTREHHQRQHFLALQQKETQERRQNVEIMTAAERMELMHLRNIGVAEQDSTKCLGHNLSTWILNDRLMERLFSAEFLHTETLKRSSEIPRFLAWLGRLSNDHVELIWNAARQSAHESIRHAVLQLLQGLFPVLSRQQLCLVNSFARRLSKSEFDGRTLLLLKHLAASAAKLEKDRLTELGLEAVAEQELLAPITTAAAAAGLGGVAVGCGKGGGERRSRRGALSGLEVLWECVLDDEAAAERGTLSPGLHEEALICLMHIVGHLTGGLPCSTDPRVWLLDEVVICLKERKSVVQALRVLQALLDSFHQFVITVISRQGSDRPEENRDREGVPPVTELPGTQQGMKDANASEKPKTSQSDEEVVQPNGVGGDGRRASPAGDGDDSKRGVCRREQGSQESPKKKEAQAVPAAVSTSPASQQTRRRRRQPQLTAITAVQIATNMGITDLALAELMQYKEYACRKVRELGLESGEAIDATVLEGKIYRHLDAMRYRLRLLQTLVSLTSHVITQAQAEGLWLGLVERALSDSELDLSFEALLTLGRDTPQGLSTLSRTFFERICCKHEGPTVPGDGIGRSLREIEASPCAGDFVTVGKAPEQRRLFHLRKLRPPGFRFFISSLEATNLALGRLRHRGVIANGTASAGRTVLGTMGGICGGGDGDDHPATMQGPLVFELSEGVDSAGIRGRKFGVTASVSMPKYVVVSMNLMGLEALWSIALEVEAEEVSEAAIKKLCELCLHVEVSEDVPAEAVARERAAFVSRCTERLARAAAVLGPGRDCRTEDRASEAERNAAVVSAMRSLQLLLAYLDEAGGRMRAQGLSVHSHCGNQVVSSMVTVRVQIYQVGTIELGILSHQTVHNLRLAVANSQGPEWTAAGTRLIFRGRELGDDSTLEEEGLLEGGVVQAVKRIKPTTSEQISTPTRIRPSSRAKESPETGPVGALYFSSTPETVVSSNKTGGHSGEQRGRKRMASFDASDPCEEGLAPRRKLRANSGASDMSGGGSAATVPTSMDIDEPSDSWEKEESEATANGNRGREGSSLPTASSVFSGGIVTEGMGAGSSPSENPRASAVGRGPSEIGVAPKVNAKVAPPELPLLELEKQSTVDTLFELMESGQSVSVLVWDLLMKMPTNMSLYNGFSSIGLNSVPKNAAESPLAFLHHASPSRLLYSLMIVENLFDRDLMREEGMAGPGTDMAAQLALEGAIEQRNHAYDLDSAESVIGPRRDAVAAVARRPQRGFEGDDWEDFPLDCGRIHIHTGNRTWRERFVRSGGINTLVELLLARDWDVARTGAGGGEGTVGISLAWLALLLVLLERFMDGGFLPQPKQLRQLLERLPVVLLTTSRCYRELTCPPVRDGGSAECSPYSRGRQAGPQGNAAGVGGGVSCKGEFDPLVEAVKAARSCATIINHLLSFDPCLTSGTSETFELLTLRGRADMAIAMASSTAFGEAVREALVRSPSRDLRVNTMALLASLAGIDGALVEEERKARIAGGDGCSTSLMTIITRLLLSLVPYCRTEPDGSRCSELYELLSDFISKGGLDLHAVCDALPGLPPPSPRLVSGRVSSTNNRDDFGAFYCDVDGPLLGPASPWEQKFVAPAVASLSVFISKDGGDSLVVQAVPILVWLMRLIVEPRVTAADGHLSGLLGLARVVVRWLGPRGKEAVGLWGLEGIAVPRRQREDGEEEGKRSAGGLLHHVYHDCLFDIATHENHGPLAPPKCRSEICRANAFGLLTDLATGCRPNVAVLINLLLRHHSTTSPCQIPKLPSFLNPFCTDAFVDVSDADALAVGGCGVEGGVERTSWSYAPRQTDKADCGYVGLQNLGATCYMNSLLQQLFMVPALRFGVLSCDPFFRTEEEKRKGVEVVPPEENLLYQLQVMFGYLQESEKKFLDPRAMCRACKDAGGQPVDPLEQQDVDEFLLVFLDRLETQLKNLPQKRLLQHVFGGELCNQLIGQESECPHVSERREDFFVLGLDVKGKRSITESLQLYVEGEVLAGDNKFHCAQCDQKRDTLKRTCIARLPNVLFLHLKRFEFDMEQMRKVKVNDYCQFPLELNMRPYTKEGLLDQQRGKLGGTEVSGKEEQNFRGATAAYPDAYYEYKLAGVLVHTGTADSGHYYSYIKRRNVQGGGGSDGDAESESWFSFNDALVTPFDRGSLQSTCYGGYAINANGRGMTIRQWSAYMLIYEREYVLPNPAPAATPVPTPTTEMATPSQDSNSPSNGLPPKESERAAPPAGDTDLGSVWGGGDLWEPPWWGVPRPSELVPPSVFQACWRENRLFLMDKNVFSAEYLNWVCDLTALVPPPKAPYLSVTPSMASNRDGQGEGRGHNSDSVHVDVDVDEVESSAAKVALYLALDTVARAKDKERLSQLILYVRNWFRGSSSVCRWALEQMTTNNYWQHTILLQCSLHGVRNEFLQLCVELCRCYAPLERQLYYQEDPDIGQQQYLSAVPRRRQQEEVEEGCGEDARRKRQQGGAVDQGSRDETLSNPALEALSNMTEAERCVFIKEHAREVLCKYPSSVDSGEGTDGGSDMSETGSVATDEADFGDRVEEDWPHSPASSSFVRHNPPSQTPGTAASCSSSNVMEEDEPSACAAARARITPADAAQSPSSPIFPTPQPPSISSSTPPRTPPRRPPLTPPSSGVVGSDATRFNCETQASSKAAARRPGVGVVMWTRLGKLAVATTGIEERDKTRECSTTPRRCLQESRHKADRGEFGAVEQQQGRAGHRVECETGVKGEVEENGDRSRCGSSAEESGKGTSGAEKDQRGVSTVRSPGSAKKRSLAEMESAPGVDRGNAEGREGGGEVCRGNGAPATDGVSKGEGQSGNRRLADRAMKKSKNDIKVLREQVPRRLRWWDSRSLVCRFIGTILDLVHELPGASGKGLGRSRGFGSGVGARRGTPLAQMRKQSEHLYGLLLEIARISPAETRLLVRMGAIPRVLHSILGEAWPLVSGEFLERHGCEDSGPDVHQSGSFGENQTVGAWVSGTNAFAPCLKLITELACSCPVAGDNPPVFKSEMEIPGCEETRLGDKAGDGWRRTVASVHVQEYESCFTSSMDPSARDNHDEEMIVLPHAGEVRMLTDPAVLEILLVGRPKANTIPQPRLQHEQVLIVVRLTRHVCWNSPSVTEMVMTECAKGLQEKQVQMFYMHLRVLMGLSGITDQHRHQRVVQVLDHLLRAAEINLEFSKECLEIWRVLAKGLLGMMPEIIPSDVLPTLRITLLQQSERIITVFLLNPKLTADVRQTAAFCLQIAIPEMWVTNGYHTPRCLPLNALNSLKLSPSIAHDAGAAVGSPVGRSSSIFAAGSTPSPGVVSTPTSAAAASAAIAQVAGWDPRGDKRDSERTREEDVAEERSLAVAFADNDDAMAVEGGSTSAESSDDVQILGVVPGVPKNSDVSPKVSRGNGGCGNGEDVRGTSRWSEPAPSSGEAGGSTPRPVGPQQQQQHGGHERGSNGATKELCRKDGLSQQSMEQANWLMQQLMKEVPRAVNIIEALKAAGEGANHRAQQVNFFEMVQLMTHLITGSKTERESLAITMPDFLESFFKLDRMRRTDDQTKGIMVKFIYDVMERHPQLCSNLKEESVANSLLVYFVSWQDKHSNADYNATYASVFYKLLLKACTLYPSVLDLVRQSANLHWCMEWFILRGHCPTMEMAITLMSILKLCLRRYGWSFAMEAVAWIIGPPASDMYLKVDEQNPNARVPLYALWMLEVCLRDQLGNEEMGAVQHLIKSEGALDQVTRILIHVRDTERVMPRQMLTGRSQLPTQDRHRKALVLCENLLSYVYDWVQFGTVNELRRLEGGNCSSTGSTQDETNTPHRSSESNKSVDQGDLQRAEKAQQDDPSVQGCSGDVHADQVKQEADAKAPIGRSRRCSKVVNGVGGVREEEAETKGRRGQGQRGDVEDQRDGQQQQQPRKRRQMQQLRLKQVQQQGTSTERLEQLQPQSSCSERLELLQRKWHHARDAAVWLFHRLLQWEQSSAFGGCGKVIEDTERYDLGTSDWMPRQDTRVRLRKLLNLLVSNIPLCARDVGEAIVTETTRRVQRMAQVHIHRRNGEGSGAGGSNTGVKDTRNGAYEAQMLLMKEISSKITPYLKQSVTEFQNEARVHMLEAEELTVQLSANRGVGAKADGEAKGSGDGSEAKNKKVETGAREAQEEQRRIHTSGAEKSQQSAEIYASVVTNLLYATATAASSSDMKSANNVAKSLQDQISRGDPYALRLVSGAYAESFLGHLVEHCAPVSGCVRQYGGEDLEVDVGSSDILGLVAVMVPEALKHMEDQALNIHLSTLCNSLADAASDIIRNLQDGACSNGDGGATSIRGRGDNRDGHACKEAAGGSGNGGSSVQDMEIAKSENREHPAYAGVRAFKEVCLWLDLFFKASEGTKEACHAGCLGALTDLSQAADEHADAFIASELRDSIKIFDLTQQSSVDCDNVM